MVAPKPKPCEHDQRNFPLEDKGRLHWRRVRLRASHTRCQRWHHHESANWSDLVVLLHGFGTRPWFMRLIERRLQQSEFEVMNWGYRSTRRSVASHSRLLRSALEVSGALRRFERIHLVGYSMGGIIARHAVAAEPDLPPGRVVLLGAPNRGTHVARTAARVIGRFCPALSDLSDHDQSMANRIRTPSGREIGVIAADNDWVVPVCNTYLEGQRDHIVVTGDHLRLPLLRESSRQVITFLQNGAFAHSH